MKQEEKKPPKKRENEYDEKVKFEGSLEQMIKIAVKTPPKKITK